MNSLDDMGGRLLEPMQVGRVARDRASVVDPPLNPWWTREKKLRWQAAVVSHDTGVPIVLTAHGWWPLARYAIHFASGAFMEAPYATARDRLEGIRVGIEIARREHEENA